ncbi:MAG: ProQ/FINO family protein [Rhodomicrobium sp.]
MQDKLAQLTAKELEAAILPTLVTHFPRAFFERGKTCRPLRIGIYDEICAALPDINRQMLSRYLNNYVMSSRYLREILPGVTRVDLNGYPAGFVTEHDADSAKRRWNGLYGEGAKSRAEAKAANGADVKGEKGEIFEAAPAPTPPEQAPEPEVLSLDTGIPVSTVAAPEPAKPKLKWPKPGASGVKVEKVNGRSARKQTLDDMAAALRAKTEFQAKRNEAIEKLRGAR